MVTGAEAPAQQVCGQRFLTKLSSSPPASENVACTVSARLLLIAVGIPLTWYPPYRSGRAPKVRRPESLKQALWGGGTCMKCGCEMDKWGRLITLAR